MPLPVPGDLFIAAMGFLAHSGRAAFAPTAAVVTVATVLGAGPCTSCLATPDARCSCASHAASGQRRARGAARGVARPPRRRGRRGPPARPRLCIVMTVVARAAAAPVHLRAGHARRGWCGRRCTSGSAGARASYERVARAGALPAFWPAVVAVAILAAAPRLRGAPAAGARRASSPDTLAGAARPARAAPCRGRSRPSERRPWSVAGLAAGACAPTFRSMDGATIIRRSCSWRATPVCVKPSGRCWSGRATRSPWCATAPRAWSPLARPAAGGDPRRPLHAPHDVDHGLACGARRGSRACRSSR